MQVGTAGFVSIQITKAWVINNALGQGGTREFFALMSTPWDNMTLRTASPPPFTAYHIGMSSCNHSDKYNKLLAERLQIWCTTGNFIVLYISSVMCEMCGLIGCLSWYSSYLNNMDIVVELWITRICHDRPWCLLQMRTLTHKQLLYYIKQMTLPWRREYANDAMGFVLTMTVLQA